MGAFVKAAILAGAGLSLTSFSLEPRLSPAILAALDPSRIAGTLCGAQRAGSALAARLLVAAAFAAPASAALPIPLYDDLAGSPFPVTTASLQARRYFSQGLLLSYGFNHAGAVRSFREAQRLDPDCAMCWWGEAVALGPNINAPMDDRDRAAALDAMDRAMALRDRASPMEKALIEAVALRYSRDPAADRAALDAAYADAMLAAARRFPGDDDVAVLAAEAAMDTTPWNYWEADKITPIGRTGEAVRLVEAVLARNPAHPQAAHLYIHLVEASDAKRAEAAADRLSSPVAPSAAHLVHMPGHIYYVLGRYSDSIRVNIAAVRSDEAFIRATDDRSLVRYGYYPHNIHFIVTSAQMAGDMDTAIREAARLRTVLDPETSAKIAWIQAIDAAPYQAMAQFAAPDEILAMPAPDARLPYAAAMRHYARAVAHAGRKDRAAFDSEIKAMDALLASDAFADMVAQGMPAPDLIALAKAVAQGRLATAQGRYDEAAGFYRAAITIEGTLPYMEPPYWYYPVHQSLGAALFLAGRYDEASQAFRTALARAPRNGWVLYGLSRSEAAQGRKSEAAAARQAFSRAWAGKDEWLRMERL
ncbi:tetratricopeptide repeat protein [Edaphosphingomonas haloaromaticamans]|uniref:Tetratricopeptide repeat protein n=1 Tax=Edaphosphingomonas haloaromaticamans TaxID=653954 RepID=A0A1S1HIP8_9SPHN|nr:tetratricopeptide repeat protein [Sphingomonas haloaromaticamans]OHT21093.1 Tetratricopeptide repeat protein [Sphingomonas haloaromaticamans]